MILLLFLLALVALNVLAAWRGVDSRDGRDWTGVPPVAPAREHFGIAMPPGARASVGE